MRAWGFLALAVLTGCGAEPKLRADSEANFRRSYERIARVTSAERLAALDAALLGILQARARTQDVDCTETFSGAAEIAPPARGFVQLVENWPQARPSLVVSQAGPMVNGRSIDEIVALSERRQRLAEGRIAAWTARLSESPEDLWKIERAPEPPVLLEADKALLARVKITRESEMALGEGEASGRVIAFLIENGLDAPLRSVLLSTRDPARAGEALQASFEYVFPVNLAAGSTQRVISRIMLPARSARAPEAVKDEFRLHVAGVQIRTGRTIGLGAPASAPAAPRHWSPYSLTPSY